jgi:hypothetical protein
MVPGRIVQSLRKMPGRRVQGTHKRKIWHVLQSADDQVDRNDMEDPVLIRAGNASWRCRGQPVTRDAVMELP